MKNLTQMKNATRFRNSWALGFLLAAFVTILPSTASAQEDRVVVAVLSTNTNMLRSSWDFRFDPSELGPLATSMLTSELAKHGSFRVVERSYIDTVLAEQDRGSTDRFDPQYAAQLGQLMGAQVVVVADIHSFGIRRDQLGGGFGGLVKKQFKVGNIDLSKTKTSADMMARLVDANTGEILAVAEAEGSTSSASLDGLFRDQTGRGSGGLASDQVQGAASVVLEDVIGDLGKQLAKKAKDLDLPPVLTCLSGHVADVDGGEVFLTISARDDVEVGEFFEVEKLGKEIKDPVTGKSLGQRRKSLGFVRITDVDESYSIAEIVEGEGFAAGNVASRSAGPDRPDVRCREIYRPTGESAGTGEPGAETTLAGNDSETPGTE